MKCSPIAIIIALLLLSIGCSQGSDRTPVPRRTAYPRVMPYDSTYVCLDSLPVDVMVNAAINADVTSKDDGTIWITLPYYRYGAKVFCTVTPVTAQSVEEVISNRAERIYLNLGSATPSITDFDNDGNYHSTVVVSRGGIATPLQFLSVNRDNPKWVVSGTVFFDESAVDEASISPMVDVIERDLKVMLNHLSDK